MMLEFTHWASGDLEAAYRAMGDWMNSMEKVGNFAFAVASTFALADIIVAQGHLHEAVRTYLQSLHLASEHEKDVQQVTAHLHLGLAMLQHEMGDDATSAQHVQKARELGEQTTLVDWPYRWHLAQARLKESGGDLEAALVLLDEARRVFVKNPVPDTRPIAALKAKVYLKQGRLALAKDWAHARGLTADDEISYLGEFEHITLARVLIAEYQSNQGEHSIRQAIGLLERLLKVADAQKREGSVLEILLVQALAHQAQGNLPLALASLERALTLAEPEGYVRIFVDEGDAMRLLILDFRSRIEKQSSGQDHPLLGYVEKLISAFARPVEKQLTISNVKSEMIEPLSPRELEILQLIAQGLSNPEIGKRLFLALDTIKGHNRRIFDKLQVQRRTEAVARAHELGLI